MIAKVIGEVMAEAIAEVIGGVIVHREGYQVFYAAIMCTEGDLIV